MTSSTAAAPIYMDASHSIPDRVEDLLAQMTIQEKVAQLGSAGMLELLEGQSFSEAKAAVAMGNSIGRTGRIGGGGWPAIVDLAASRPQGSLEIPG
jgi:hypothetical protein